jgi:hypothetical protein
VLGGQSSCTRPRLVLVALQMNGPATSTSSSNRRHCDITTSSCCHVFRASLPVSAIIFAPFSRTAAISARWSWIRLSRDPDAIERGRIVDRAWRSGPSVDRGARIPRISRVAPQSSNDARDAKDVRVEVEADV